jgi:hyperosmotically inducible periplasmic protein
MMRRIYCALLGFIIVLQLSGCTALTGETLGQNVDDTTITTTVKSRLALEKASSLTRVGVDTVKGVVHLTGIVESPAIRDRAEDIARNVGGVRGVANNLQVQTKQ